MHRRREKFTFIELMFVTVIILIIVGLLIPALSRSKEKARRINCASNLKRIGISMRSYSIDYAEWFPNPYPPGTVSADTGEPKSAVDKLVETGYLTAALTYHCPSVLDKPSIDNDNHIVNMSFLYIVDDVGPVAEKNAGTDTGIMSDKLTNHVAFGNIMFSDSRIVPLAGSKWNELPEIPVALRTYINK